MAKFKPVMRICKKPSCKNKFLSKRKWHDYCSDHCRITNWQDEHPQITPEELKQIKEKLGIKI